GFRSGYSSVATSSSQPIRAEDLAVGADAHIGRETVADLKLGPLPKHNTVRVPLVLSEPFKEELDAYAIEHSKQHGEPVPETAELIIHILETFLRPDPGWRSHRKQRGKSKPVNGKPARSAPQTSTTE